MKLSVSNIAWPASLSQNVFAVLRSFGVSGLEVAPTRLWPEWEGATVGAARRYRKQLLEEDLTISSLQSILYAKPECTLFVSASERRQTLAHIELCASLAAAFGAESMVFGAPRNRRRDTQPFSSVLPVAIEFFSAAAEICLSNGVCLCLEANPVIYGCDFMCTSGEAAAIVRTVDSPGLRLHLDTGCMHLSEEDAEDAIRNNLRYLQHFHVSEPHLGTFEEPRVDHARAAQALTDYGYSNWVTLEMRATEHPLQELKTAVKYLSNVYRWRNFHQPVGVACSRQ